MEKTETNKMVGDTPNKKNKTIEYSVKGKGAKKTTKKVKDDKTEEVDVEKKEKAVEVIREVVELNPQGISKLTLDKGKIELLKNTIARGATDDELKMFINVCTGMGLSPFLNQIHMVKRWDRKLGRDKATIQVGIDGFRSIAENTGAYAGNDDPIMAKEKDTDTHPSQATVTVYKIVQGQRYPFTATARWSEFFPGDKIGFMWTKMPNVMLGKCAEAQALRKAFPKVLGGVYSPEEMDQAGETKIVKQTPMQLAEVMINKETNKDNLISFEERIKKADKYTDEQKKRLLEILGARVDALTNEENAKA